MGITVDFLDLRLVERAFLFAFIAAALLFFSRRKKRRDTGAIPANFALVYGGAGYHAGLLTDLWLAGVKGTDLLNTAYLTAAARSRHSRIVGLALIAVGVALLSVSRGQYDIEMFMLLLAAMMAGWRLNDLGLRYGVGTAALVTCGVFLALHVDKGWYARATGKRGCFAIALTSIIFGGLTVAILVVTSIGYYYIPLILTALCVAATFAPEMFGARLERFGAKRRELVLSVADEFFDRFVREVILGEERPST